MYFTIFSTFILIQFVSICPYFQREIDNDEYLPKDIFKFGEKITTDSLTPSEISSNKQNGSFLLCNLRSLNEEKNALRNERMRWYRLRNGNYGVLTVIDTKFSEQRRNNIRQAMKIIQDKLCLEFLVYQNANSLRGYDYGFIHGDSGGCSSWIGRLGRGKQDVTLEGGCADRIPTIVHELLHLVGLHHEHQRSDRDRYVDILWNNVDNAYRHAFDLLSDREYTTYGQAYDTLSIMHYPQSAFTKNGQDTIRSKEGKQIGWNNDMTAGDLYKVKQMYKCQ